jgi:transcriptional regulator with XRE-family HTH domain
MYGDKIRIIREVRGFSQEYMADKLGIKQNTFSKIELNQQKLTANLLQKIADELGVSPVDILSNQPTIVNFEASACFQKELIAKIVECKDAEIATLKIIIGGLMKDKERLMNLLENIHKLP